MFSSYLGGKSANRGACAQACRRLYANDAESGYWFSPDDLQLIEYVPDLMEAGVESFKIEGRMKSAEYVGSVVAAYRYMIDNWKLDRERALVKAQAMLQSDFARRKTRFFFAGRVDPEFIKPHQSGGTGISLGKVRDIRVIEEGRYALLNSIDGLAEGDSLRFHRPDDSERITAKVREVMRVSNGMLVRSDADFRQSDEVYLVQTRSMARRYSPALPRDLARYRKFPSRDTAPEPDRTGASKADLAALPDGFYALVAATGDLHILNAARPKKAMLLFTRKNAAIMRKEEKELPFKRDSLILWLDPFFPESDAEWLASEIEYWIGRGQRIFVANNVGHLALLRGMGQKAHEGLAIVAGPYLYAFNRWAASFLLEEGARFVVPPLEISKQDFQKVAEAAPAASWMPIVFSYPALFRIRADLADVYDFRTFSDRDGSTYELSSSGEGSVVTPMKPFSIIDRIPFLQKDGFGKFILDFSSIKLTKTLYKQVMRAAAEGRLLPDTGRFNWKEGFWMPEETNGPGGGVADRGREG
jgi:putative protease